MFTAGCNWQSSVCILLQMLLDAEMQLTRFGKFLMFAYCRSRLLYAVCEIVISKQHSIVGRTMMFIPKCKLWFPGHQISWVSD